ncbi:MAG: hypothetical protein NZ777_01495, partial [Pseudomonadales bacterium]|nr:hypothetical protein [Pseudomonadales bacterium]
PEAPWSESINDYPYNQRPINTQVAAINDRSSIHAQFPARRTAYTENPGTCALSMTTSPGKPENLHGAQKGKITGTVMSVLRAFAGRVI